MEATLRSKIKQSVHLQVEPDQRLRRLRRHPAMRELVREHHLNVGDLIAPLYINGGHKLRLELPSIPGQYQCSIDLLVAEIQQIVALGIKAVMLFAVSSYKDKVGSRALDPKGIIPQAVRIIKQHAPQLLIITDLCFCAYTSHGHCGALCHDAVNQHDLDNDYTLSLLAQQAVIHATAGADLVAPSGMLDGTVASIRAALDDAAFTQIPIMSYAVRFNSVFYGLDAAAGSATPLITRNTYQIDPANVAEATREADQDVAEGVDILMVGPAGSYLDVIYRIKQDNLQIPLAAYQSSGEYAMIKNAAQHGWLDEGRAMMESLIAIKRAGANLIVSNFAVDCAKLLASNN